MVPIKNVSGKNNLSLDNVCNLVSQTYESDDIGNQIATETEKTVFCAELPITSAERTNTAINGIKPEVCLVVDYESYDEQKLINYNGVRYSVYRKYPRSDGMVELYCAKKVGV